MNAHAMYNEVETVDPDGLVAANANLVKRIAFHLMNRLPPSVQAEDLIQAGMIGLLEAARHYDPSQGASFETYAGIRVRGAMLDEIRRSDWTPRSVHRKSREAAETLRSIEQQSGRDARGADVADKMGLPLSAYHLILTESTAAHIFSFDQPDDHTGETFALPQSDEATPGESIEYASFRKALAESIANLPERESLVMSLYYDEDLNLREIGDILGVSESRVCQIHGQALVRLKARLTEWTQKRADMNELMTSEEQQWYVQSGSRVQGPYSTTEVGRYLLLGRVRNTDRVSKDGELWEPVTQVPELIPEELLDLNSDSGWNRYLTARSGLDERNNDIAVLNVDRRSTGEAKSVSTVREQWIQQQQKPALPPGRSANILPMSLLGVTLVALLVVIYLNSFAAHAL